MSAACPERRPRGAARSSVVLLAAMVGLGSLSCYRASQPSPAPRLQVSGFSGTNAYKEVAGLVAVGRRDAGTEGAALAAGHIKARLDQLGIPAEVDEFGDETPDGSRRFRNVVGRIPGGSRRIILMAHYDTKSGIGERFQGANDSGSGVGVLLELARVIVDARRAGESRRTGDAGAGLRDDPSLWFAFLDGEECRHRYGPQDGLHGSRHMAAQVTAGEDAGKIVAAILVDMVGDRDLSITIPRNGTPELAALAFRAAEEEGVRSLFSLLPGSILDDHQPFLDRGIPALDLIDFEYGSRPRSNDYWHTEQDTLEHVSPESLATVGRVLIRMLNAL